MNELINNGQDFGLPQQESRSNSIFQIENAIDSAIVEKNKKQKKRDYLGGSSLGEECSRKIQYRFMGTEVDREKGFSAKTLRIFQFGHSIEDQMADWIRAGGFDLKTEDKNAEQFGFSIANGKIRGHIDGVICGGPSGIDIKYPMLWECKSANDRKFKEFVKNGMAKTNAVYAAQIAVYQAYMELTENPALFTVLNKNTSEIYYEFVKFDKYLAQNISDRAADILASVSAGEMLPRIAHNSDYFSCKWCEFHKTCWQ